MPQTRRVAVIGAGISGIMAMKCFKEEGFDITCFEKTEHVGGLWRYHDDDVEGIASVMKTTVINASKEMGAISDFPPPAEYPNYMHNSLMHQYISSSVEKFDLAQYIKFNHELVNVEKTDDYEVTGRWKVTYKNTQTEELKTDLFDCVVICNGQHTYPNIPTFPGQEKFFGKIIHSHSLKTTQGFENLRIVVVGAGSSAMDAAVELSSVAKQVYLSCRNGLFVFPRAGAYGLPFDAWAIRRSIFLLMRLLPFSLLSYITYKWMSRYFDPDLYGLKPKHGIFSYSITISDALPSKLLNGTVVARGNIKMFTRNGVVFEGEENETPADVVILCTGYRVKFPFLSDDILPVKNNRISLYKFVFPPDLPHSTFAVIGLIRPNGPGLPVVEMQCRWASKIMNGKHFLPSRNKMHVAIKKQDDLNREKFSDSPKHTIETDYIGYTDELAEEIGVKPNLLTLALTDPELFWAVFFGPFLPYQYRLQGPQAWNGARDAILLYDERVKIPLRRPAAKDTSKEKELYKFNLTIKTLLVLFSVWYIFSAVLNYCKNV